MMTIDTNWRQVDGDVNPSDYGCTLARLDGDAIELLQIQPVREYVSKAEACEVGVPFWTKEAWYSFEDLDSQEARDIAVSFGGLDDCLAQMRHNDNEPSQLELRVMIATMLLQYGWRSDEGTAGWARDVFPPKAYYLNRKRPVSGAAFSDSDREFRRMLREQSR